MKYKDVLRMFSSDPSLHSVDVLISKKTAQIFLDNGFKVIKIGVNNYEVYRRVN
jgi:hypothetical protein